MNWKFPGESFSSLKRNMYDGVGGMGATKSERILTEAACNRVGEGGRE